MAQESVLLGGVQVVRLTGLPGVPSIVKVTVPVGPVEPVLPCTLAVKVTDVPYVEGFDDEVTVVVVFTMAEFTTIPDCVPVMDAVTVSVAVMDCVPAVLNVALNVATPLSLLLCPVVKL